MLFIYIWHKQHEYDAAQKDFDKASTTLKTCNQFTPAQNNPQKYQAVDTPDEVRDIPYVLFLEAYLWFLLDCIHV